MRAAGGDAALGGGLLLLLLPRGFASDEPLEMVVISSLVAFAVLFSAAWLLRWRGERRARRLRFGAPDRGQARGWRRT